MATERARVNALAQWVGQQLKARPTVVRQQVSGTMGSNLTVNTNRAITLTWPTPFADATYSAWAVLTGAAGVVTGPVSLVVTAQTATTVTVTVRAGLALAASVSFTVHGLR